MLHLVGVFLFVAGSGAATVLGVAQARTSETTVMARLARLSEIAEWSLVYPGLVIAIVFGSWLVDEAGYDFGDAWLTASYILWVVAVLVGLLVLIPATRRLRRRADDLVAEGVVTSTELRAQAAAPLIGILGALEDLAIIAFLYLMVAKPGA